jgi:hypothetical protein
MDVRDDIWLRLPLPETSDGGRVMVSGGTTTPQQAPDRGPAYMAEARVPTLDWRAVAEHDFRRLQAVPASAGRGNVIRIMRVPDEVIRPFRAARRRDGAVTWNGAGALREPGFEDAEREAQPYIRSLALTADGLSFLGREVRRPGQVTTAIDERLGLRVGLHVDSWDGWHPDHAGGRGEYRTRLSINLGTATRYLLFMQVPRDAVLQGVDEARIALGPTRLLQSYLEAHPDVPVYRLAIRPGEAYIAPIDAMPHDSSTWGMGVDDVTLSAVGHFDTLAG